MFSLSNFQNAYIFLHIPLSDNVTIAIILAIRFSCLNFCVAFLSCSFCYVYFFTIQLRSPFSYPYPYTSCQYIWCISMFHYIFIIITCVCTRIWKFDWTDFQSMLCKQKNVTNMRSFNKGKHMMMICMKQKIDDSGK